MGLGPGIRAFNRPLRVHEVTYRAFADALAIPGPSPMCAEISVELIVVPISLGAHVCAGFKAGLPLRLPSSPAPADLSSSYGYAQA